MPETSREEHTLEKDEFRQWFAANYPGPNTIIHDPNWHAPKIWNAATFALRAEIQRLQQQVMTLESAVQSRHDYGPASPGEQEAAWQRYCRRSGWDVDSHPAAKNAYCEGFCDGDSYSEGEEGRAVLRTEVQALRDERERHCKHIEELKQSYLEKMTKACELESQLASLSEQLTASRKTVVQDQELFKTIAMGLGLDWPLPDARTIYEILLKYSAASAELTAKEKENQELTSLFGDRYCRLLVRDEDGDIIVDFPELRGCVAHGETLPEALKNAEEMKQLWLDSARDHEEELPKPMSSDEFADFSNGHIKAIRDLTAKVESLQDQLDAKVAASEIATLANEELIERLNAEVESLEGQLEDLQLVTAEEITKGDVKRYHDHLQKRIHALEEALKFYADADHWTEYRGSLAPHFYLSVKEFHRPWDVAKEALRNLNPPSGEATTTKENG